MENAKKYNGREGLKGLVRQELKELRQWKRRRVKDHLKSVSIDKEKKRGE